jgi:hypothetical protein
MDEICDETTTTRITLDTHLEVVSGFEPAVRGRRPRRYVVWPGLATMLAIALVVGLGNWAFFDQEVNPRNRATDENGDALGMYVQALMLIWSIVSGWLLYRVDEESSKVAEAVAEGDLKTFRREASKRIALTVRLLHLALSLLFIHSFHLFHIGNRVTSFEIQAGIGFLVSLTVLFIWDLDDPLHGVLNVAGIPPEWREQLDA